jgi:catechol 2,3-dioxygenase-like lactoylglutathione lyase family enzyme
MTAESILAGATFGPSLAAGDLARARRWYAEKLELVPTLERRGELIYRVGRSTFSVFESPDAGTARNTVAAWNVADLRAEKARVRGRGVVFEDYDFDDLKTVDGVATNADGALDAYFIDSERNTIVLGQPAKPGPTQFFAILAAADVERASRWYAEKLGLEPDERSAGLLVYLGPGRTLFVMYQTALAGTARNTVGTWRVRDLDDVVLELRQRGVTLDRNGPTTAWFMDSEANRLALSEDREALDSPDVSPLRERSGGSSQLPELSRQPERLEDR